MKREKIEEFPLEIMNEIYVNYKKKIDKLGWEYVDEELTSSDPEDGGAYYFTILKRLSDDKFFKIEWCDWDREDGQYGEGKFVHPISAEEVFPKTIEKTIYQ